MARLSVRRAGDPRVLPLAEDPRSYSRRLQWAVVDRTQEFTLGWSSHRGEIHRQIVRQQFAFSQFGATREQQEYDVELHDVTALELRIVPDVDGGEALASLAEFKVA